MSELSQVLEETNKIVKQGTVTFYGATLRCAVDSDDRIWVSVKEVCESIGVDRKGQQEKLKTREDLNWGDISMVAEDGKNRTQFCIEVEDLPAWLYSISPDKVKPEIKPMLIRLQKECSKVIREHFFPSKAIQPQTPQEMVLASIQYLMEQVAVEKAAKEEAIRTKALISDKKTATALATASSAVKAKNKAEAERDEMAVQLGQLKQWATITAVENRFGKKLQWRPLRQWHDDHNVPIKRVHDERYGSVLSYHADAWKEVYGVIL